LSKAFRQVLIFSLILLRICTFNSFRQNHLLQFINQMFNWCWR
jgi:hypothetical protein